MNPISKIIKSWWISANPTPEQSDLAEKRLEICVGCEARRDSVVFGYICGECGCPLGKKIFTPGKKACPKAKWNEVEDASYLK